MSANDDIVFFTAQTSDATSSSFRFLFSNRRAQFVVWGTLGGATITLQFSPDGGTSWVTVKDMNGNDVAYTVARAVEIVAPHGELLRCVIAGSSAASINAKLQVI